MMQYKKIFGMSLLEMMFVVAIIAILTVVTMTVYTSRVRESRRADGVNTLAAMALAEERYRTNNVQYGSLAQVWSGVTTSPGGFYTLSISGTSGTGYTLTATAIGTQASDTESGTSCATLVLTVSNGSVTKTPSVCWAQ